MHVQKQPGELGFLMPVMEGGRPKVFLAEMLVGVLLEMVSGSELTPKGGLCKLLKAHEAAQVHSRCIRSEGNMHRGYVHREGMLLVHRDACA